MSIDLIGGPFAVIESDPGVFTSLTRKLGVKNLSLVEVYDIEPWATDHLHPYGLIFCFHWRKDPDAQKPAEDLDDPAEEQVWFANQLSDDACASHAILNVLLNCPSLDLGPNLQEFKTETESMSPVMKGLSVTNSAFIRNAHNSLARPADIRGALYAIAATTVDAADSKKAEAEAQAKKEKKAESSTTAKKRASTSKTKAKTKKVPKNSKKTSTNTSDAAAENEETYHFIGYVPAFGKVWELDGLKSRPLEVGELLETGQWMDIARPALRMKMAKYGGSADAGGDANIRFSLLALVDGTYEKANDEWEYWRRERKVVERRLDEIEDSWRAKVDPELLVAAEHAFTLSEGPAPGRMFLQGGAQRLARDAEILSSSPEMLIQNWEGAVRNALRTKVAVEDELSRETREHTDHIKRTHDYEPFFEEYIRCLQKDGLLDLLLDNNKAAHKAKANGTAKKPKLMDADEVPDEDDAMDEDGSEDEDDDWRPSASRRKKQ